MHHMAVAVFLAALTSSAATEPIKPEVAELYAGREATVGGTAHVSKPNTGTVTFIEVSVPGNPATVTGIVMSGDEPKFPNLKDYDGKKIDITGVLQHFKGTLRIVLIRPDQIKLVP
jgi:DNA/RNA endonuclease YhcR with UshA esterase domain